MLQSGHTLAELVYSRVSVLLEYILSLTVLPVLTVTWCGNYFSTLVACSGTVFCAAVLLYCFFFTKSTALSHCSLTAGKSKFLKQMLGVGFDMPSVSLCSGPWLLCCSSRSWSPFRLVLVSSSICNQLVQWNQLNKGYRSITASMALSDAIQPIMVRAVPILQLNISSQWESSLCPLHYQFFQ